MRTLSYQLPEESGRTIEEIMREELGLTKREIRSVRYQENGILLDGIRQRTSRIMEMGQRLEVNLPQENSEKFVVSWEPVHIWYEDADLLLVEKPAGVVVHPSHGHYGDSMENRLAGYFQKKGEQVGLHIVGRLDKDTSGILLVAKNRPAAGRLAAQRQEQSGRTYLALVEGHFTETELASCERYAADENAPYVIQVPIGKKEGTLNQQEAKPTATDPTLQAYTSFWIQQELEQATLVRLKIKTGRTHQIRVHMAYLGHPLLGDPIYGSTSQGRAALHSAKLECTSPFSGEQIVVESPLPIDMQQVLLGLN